MEILYKFNIITFFISTPLKVGGHIALAFQFTTSSLPVYNSVKLNSTALIFGTHLELGTHERCVMQKVLRSDLNL
jgi:hypothetical protein